MTRYEYKVLPAPTKGLKGGTAKTAEGRFAFALEGVINSEASEGWEYVRAELLPSDERQGLTSTRTVYRNVLIFRRATSATAQTIPPASTLDTTDNPPPSIRAKRDLVPARPPAEPAPAEQQDMSDAASEDAPTVFIRSPRATRD